MNDARGMFLRSERSGGEPWRVRIGAPTPQDSPEGDAAPCELPAPSDQGRVYNPPHPIFAVVFVYAVSMGLLWGATSGAGDTTPRLAMAFVALLVCLLAAVHWLEGVQPTHVAAKLGAARAPARAWWIGGAAAIPGLAWCVRGTWAALESGALGTLGGMALQAVTLVGAVLWTEAFFRGFAFRALMRRHGFLLSAGVSSVLSAAIVPFVLTVSSEAASPTAAVLLELPLALALCALFVMSGMSLGPGLCVRASVLAAALWAGGAWPALAGAVIVLVLARLTHVRRPRES